MSSTPKSQAQLAHTLSKSLKLNTTAHTTTSIMHKDHHTNVIAESYKQELQPSISHLQVLIKPVIAHPRVLFNGHCSHENRNKHRAEGEVVLKNQEDCFVKVRVKSADLLASAPLKKQLKKRCKMKKMEMFTLQYQKMNIKKERKAKTNVKRKMEKEEKEKRVKKTVQVSEKKLKLSKAKQVKEKRILSVKILRKKKGLPYQRKVSENEDYSPEPGADLKMKRSIISTRKKYLSSSKNKTSKKKAKSANKKKKNIIEKSKSRKKKKIEIKEELSDNENSETILKLPKKSPILKRSKRNFRKFIKDLDAEHKDLIEIKPKSNSKSPVKSETISVQKKRKRGRPGRPKKVYEKPLPKLKRVKVQLPNEAAFKAEVNTNNDLLSLENVEIRISSHVDIVKKESCDKQEVNESQSQTSLLKYSNMKTRKKKMIFEKSQDQDLQDLSEYENTPLKRKGRKKGAKKTGKGALG